MEGEKIKKEGLTAPEVEGLSDAELAKRVAAMEEQMTGGIKGIVGKLRERSGRKADEEEPSQWGEAAGMNNEGLPESVKERVEGRNVRTEKSL